MSRDPFLFHLLEVKDITKIIIIGQGYDNKLHRENGTKLVC